MQSLQQQTSRTKLDVSIQAPLVIIPISSTSVHALVADLGQVSVQNKFEIAGKGPDGVNDIVVDDMSVVLHSLKLTR